MKYLEFTFHTTPCTEIVNDVLSAVLGEAGFESFVEQTDGIAAYIQKDLYNETVLKEALADFPLPDTQVEYAYQEAEDISSSPLSLATAVSSTAHSIATSLKLNTI